MVKKTKKPQKGQYKSKNKFNVTKAPGSFGDPYGNDRVNSNDIMDDFYEELMEESDVLFNEAYTPGDYDD